MRADAPSEGNEIDLQQSEVPVILRKEVIDSFGHFFVDSSSHTDRIVILNAPCSSGISYFLKTIQFQFLDLDAHFFHIDLEEKSPNSILNQIFAQLMSDKNKRSDLTKFLSKRWGEGQTHNLLRSLAVSIPIIGPVFGLIEHKELGRISDINNDINALNVGIEYLANLSQSKKLIVCAEFTSDSIPPLRRFTEKFASEAFANIKFVFGSSQDKASSIAEKLSIQLEFSGLPTRMLSFPKPNKNFIKTLYEKSGIKLSEANAAQIDSQSEGNIYKILKSLKIIKRSRNICDVVFSELQHKPTVIEKKLIGYLAVAEQSLLESELSEILFDAPDVFILDVSEVRETTDKLKELAIVEVNDYGHDRLITLRANFNSSVVSSPGGKVDFLLLSQQLYDYYLKKHHSEKGIFSLKHTPLLYRLSGICDAERRPEFGKDLLRYSILMQNPQVIESGVSNIDEFDYSPGFETTLLRSIYYLSTKEYSNALKLVMDSNIHEWRDSHQAIVIEGICNNRLRKHEQADYLLRMALQGATCSEEAVLISGYLIANYLHRGMLNEAKEHFNYCRNNYQSTINYPYLLRNSAAAFCQETKLSMELEAANEFALVKNHYGEHSSRLNAGATLMAMRRFGEARKYFDGSYLELEKYGTQHATISTFNRMALDVFQGNIASAETLMTRVKKLPDHNLMMTTPYTHFYEATLFLITGSKQHARNSLENLKKELDASSLSRAKDRLYSSAAALSMACECDLQFTQELLKNAKKWPDLRDPITTQRVTGFGENWVLGARVLEVEEALDLIYPPYFAYWYMDEVSFLSRTWLSS